MKLFSRIVVLFMATAGLLSCGPSRSVSFNVTRPAEIGLPAKVNTLLLVDRTRFSNETLSIIEGLLTGEMPEDDKAAAQEALNSLKNQMANSPRFKVRILPDRLSGNSMTSAFPNALSWDTINKLCTQNQSEVLICLEVFDSDFIVTQGSRVKKRMVGEGEKKQEVSYNEYYAQGVGTVKMGFRTYNNLDKSIVDQQFVSRNNTWEAAGDNPLAAVGLLISKSKANRHLASMIGEDYAYKISPMPITVSRPFYAKSKKAPEVESGTRYADVNQWQQAIDEWKKGLNSAPRKDAGMLAYNIAIGYEVMGEYGSALSWARDAYTKYGNKDARNYVRTLEYRINEENVLKRQMGE